MDLAVRWVLDQPGVSAALWGARHPAQLEAVAGALDWKLDADTLTEIDRILQQTISDPVGPEFMAPPARKTVAA
jgi:aryl-alcohol dehydrogenase-like predicted oxidoreductase